MNRATKALARCFTIAALLPIAATAQSLPNMAVLQGLAPASAVANTPEGTAFLSANLTITGAIQTGKLQLPTLLPFPEQQLQALRDAFITGGNAAGLADGLGTSLAPAYQAKAGYSGVREFTSVSAAAANFIAYTNETTASDSNCAKYFFANGTSDGTQPVSAAALAILDGAGGTTDFIGKAYSHPAGSAGGDPFGNPRPFQTEPTFAPINGLDYFGKSSSGAAYLSGPDQDLTASPSFPSGHTTYGYAEAVLLGLMVPERYSQEIVRAAEYGNDRIILGAHYAIDVVGGRALALHDIAHLLANDPAYVGRPKARTTVITDYRQALDAARTDVRTALEAGCGHPVADCARMDNGRFSDQAANDAFYDATQTYGLPVVHEQMAGVVEDVGKVAPEAGYLLVAAFPYLSLIQADDILTATEGPGGGFLDTGSPFGLYSRINLYAAVKKAVALEASGDSRGSRIGTCDAGSARLCSSARQ